MVAAEPCPTPLEWRVVVDEFRHQCRPFGCASETGNEPIVGVTFGIGAPLYFLGPAAGDHELFALLAWLLKDEFQCVFVDLPRIRWPVQSAAELARQTLAVTTAAALLGHDRFAVFGVASGSALALDLAINVPDQVSALCLLQASARVSASMLERGLQTYGSCLPGRIGGVPGWRGLQQQNHRPWFPPFDASRFDFLLRNLGQTPTAQLSRRMRLWADLDFGQYLAAIRAPVLLVQTEGEGRLFADASRDLEKRLADVRAESMHSSGLHPYLTHPHRVAKLVRTFLESVRLRDDSSLSATLEATGAVS